MQACVYMYVCVHVSSSDCICMCLFAYVHVRVPECQHVFETCQHMFIVSFHVCAQTVLMFVFVSGFHACQHCGHHHGSVIAHLGACQLGCQLCGQC